MNPVHTTCDVHWLHAMRNALNTASVALLVVETALGDSDHARAGEYAAHARGACDRATHLLAQANPRTAARPD